MSDHGRYGGTTQSGVKPGNLRGELLRMGTELGKVAERINMKVVGVNNV